MTALAFRMLPCPDSSPALPLTAPKPARFAESPPADCRCLNLPPKKKMSEPAGVKKLDSGLILNHKTAQPPADQVARIRVEKRKGNRFVTVVTGLEHSGNDLAGLCTELKQSLGVGGSVQGRTIELQGEHTEKVTNILRSRSRQ